MANDYCLNPNCGHHRKEHQRGTGQCTKCSCPQARYTEEAKGKHAGHSTAHRGEGSRG